MLEGGRNVMAIVTEFGQGGSLWDFKHKHGFPKDCLPAKLAHDFFLQLACGVWQLHQMNIAHRDLKLENALVVINNVLFETQGDFD